MAMQFRPHDHSFKDCINGAQQVVDSGGIIYQKWWCTGCGARCAANTPNLLTQYCRCEDCGKITDVSEQGCNYAAIMSIGPCD